MANEGAALLSLYKFFTNSVANWDVLETRPSSVMLEDLRKDIAAQVNRSAPSNSTK